MFDNQEYVPGKTLWDLLELLIVPAALALTALWFSNRERKDDREAAKRALKLNEKLLQIDCKKRHCKHYYDKMTELLLEKNLREAEEERKSFRLQGRERWQH